ncbi:MAG TPA: dihydrofolate reductase [Hyphomicrobiaceae bacterium]|nr:dihydrofolate reductase [Hyphomicrobiaceae bacterium]
MTFRKIIYTLIVARSKNNVIGVQNMLPWRLPSDLKKFKQLTLGHPIIMGRRTYQSIGRALPGRPNIVISRKGELQDQGIHLVGSKEAAVKCAQDEAERLGVGEVFVIGGAEIFKLFEAEVTKVYLTEVDVILPEGDAHFDKDYSDWSVADVEDFKKSEGGNDYDFKLITYVRPQTGTVRSP